MMSYQANNSYGYQRPSQSAYGQSLPSGNQQMGSAGVYGSAPVVSFPVAPAAPTVPTSKPFYRCWDKTQNKWFYWEKDSTQTSWDEPSAVHTLIDHETGAIVPREPVVAARPVVAPVGPAVVASTSAAFTTPNSRVYPAKAVATNQARPTNINPNYSAGVSRYTQQQTSGVSAAEKARLEEADRLIAEQLQKQLSMEAEAELFASCPLPGEAAKILTDKKKVVKAKATLPTKEMDEKLIADMALSGFVVRKQKRK